MDGTLIRRKNVESSDPSSPCTNVVSYGWQPPADRLEDDIYGLEDNWSERLCDLSEHERDSVSVEVTIEAHTAKEDQPWNEVFPYGDLFGSGDSLERRELEERYWKVGIVVVFQWDCEATQVDPNGTEVREFALFVPSRNVVDGDAAMFTSIVTVNATKHRMETEDECNRVIMGTSL